MPLDVYKTLWGVPRIDEEALSSYRAAGYDGIEYKGTAALAYPSFGDWLRKYRLRFITQIHTEGHSVDEHLRSFEALIQASLPLEPVLINSQSGCDFWTFDEKCRFTAGALRVEEKYRLPVAHETHRSRMTYTPWDTAALVGVFPTLRIGCDLSHWVNVCERLLDTEGGHLEKVFPAVIHLHARVGYEQGPQVPDPRAPEYARHLEAHEGWWELLWRSQLQCGSKTSTVCPEYGPPLYHHILPYTRQPVSNTEEICEWAMRRLRSRFERIVDTQQPII